MIRGLKMDKPKVYFMDARSESPDTSLINKTVTVLKLLVSTK